ncbi:immune-associated nucleotide-binding protein 6 [Plakobranchus ocellatus]|uniref:Immune-associated nucleotide-binding protein 6 n=1 Tax=Plakobranchus ocellatus TaxID=259542 RepID=A0AAV3ZT13_9GAST|nr:immune-associated nucleotide-binding protein 6 [Plakobranchus ocellatus]
MAEAMSIRDGKGYHAILIVLKYGNRLTQEERDGFDATRKIFGEDVLKKNGIIIMTCGDCYESQQKVTFQGWCRQQTGPLKDLLDDCAGRILLFDNFTEDEAKITTMRDSLLECVARLPSNGERYTNVLFKASAKEREIAIAASGTVVDRDELILDTSLLLGEFEKCKKLEENTDDAMRDEQLKAWRKLLSRCKALERLFHKKGIKSELQKQIPAFQKTLLNFIVAKDFENQDKKECYGAMIEASAQLRTAYYEGKASALQSIGKASLFLVVAGSIAALLAYGLPPVAFFVGEAMATLITKRCYGLVNFFLSFFF